jgi:hypothetical protein
VADDSERVLANSFFINADSHTIKKDRHNTQRKIKVGKNHQAAIPTFNIYGNYLIL